MFKEFSGNLKGILKGLDKPRPFVCNGSPYDSEIFIVGFNAATEMQADFWEFWCDKKGFLKEKWFDCYITERANKPLKPGKRRRNRVSNTRQRIEWIASASTPSKCLEKNIYSKATTEAKELKKEDMDSSVFEYLLSEIKPRVVFSHGLDARKHLELLSGSAIQEGSVTEITLFGTKTKVLSMSHLSRGWSEGSSKDTGVYLNQLCTNTA